MNQQYHNIQSNKIHGNIIRFQHKGIQQFAILRKISIRKPVECYKKLPFQFFVSQNIVMTSIKTILPIQSSRIIFRRKTAYMKIFQSIIIAQQSPKILIIHESRLKRYKRKRKRRSNIIDKSIHNFQVCNLNILILSLNESQNQQIKAYPQPFYIKLLSCAFYLVQVLYTNFSGEHVLHFRSALNNKKA